VPDAARDASVEQVVLGARRPRRARDARPPSYSAAIAMTRATRRALAPLETARSALALIASSRARAPNVAVAVHDHVHDHV